MQGTHAGALLRAYSMVQSQSPYSAATLMVVLLRRECPAEIRILTLRNNFNKLRTKSLKQ